MLTTAIVIACIVCWWRMTIHINEWLPGCDDWTDWFDWAMVSTIGLITFYAYPVVLVVYGAAKLFKRAPKSLTFPLVKILTAPPGALTRNLTYESRRDRQKRRIRDLESRNRELEYQLGIGKDGH